jgi:hypothetical protein
MREHYHDGNPCPYNKRRILNAKVLAEGLLRAYLKTTGITRTDGHDKRDYPGRGGK